jgi:hypothetical protein
MVNHKSNAFLGMEYISESRRPVKKHNVDVKTSNQFLGLGHISESRNPVKKQKVDANTSNTVLSLEHITGSQNPVDVDYGPLVYWRGHMVPEDCEFERLKLANENEHERDHRIVFRDRDHVYFVDGSTGGYTSVTTVIHGMFSNFDSLGVATEMIQKPDFMSDSGGHYTKYQAMRHDTNDELVADHVLVTRIVASWEDNRVLMARLGTQLHRDIELYYNDEPVENETKEYREHFLAYAKKQYDAGLKPWRTEITVFGEKEKICGSVDMIYVDNEDRYYLRDWKRSKEISFNGFRKWGKGLLRHLPDCNYSHYCLQLNLYKYLIEKYYDIEIYDMGLVIFHPNNENFLEFEVEENAENIKALLIMHSSFSG